MKKNLHLMSVYSSFSTDLVRELNEHFPKDKNLFIFRFATPKTEFFINCIENPNAFNVDYINEHCAEYQTIFVHYMFLQPHQLMRLTDEAARKIIWVVWGDDLYHLNIRNETSFNLRKALRNLFFTWSNCSLVYQYAKKRAKEKVRLFKGIGIGYSYDEVKIRDLYGDAPPVFYAPYFSHEGSMPSLMSMREMHSNKNNDHINVLIGHSGFKFLKHDKILRLLSKYKNEKIHINLVLSYGASEKRIRSLSALAIKLFGEEKTTVLTERIPKEEYFRFLASMDIAIFPFKHQSALGNTIRLAYCGVKLYLDPEGALAKGFLINGVKTANYYEILSQSWEQFCERPRDIDLNSPLFDCFDYQKNVSAWNLLISGKSEVIS